MTADRGKVRQGGRSVTVEQPAVIEDHQARTRCRTSSGHGAVYRTGRSVPSHPLNRLSTIKRIVGDLKLFELITICPLLRYAITMNAD